MSSKGEVTSDENEQYLSYKYMGTDSTESDCIKKHVEFTKQADALQFATSHPSLKVFSCELSPQWRSYLVCDFNAFWEIYSRSSDKHFYEVIPRPSSVKLFLDLEFYKDLNKEKDGSIMRYILLSLIDKKLKEDFDIENSSTHVIILDSSSKEKFSNHLIYPNVGFTNIKECGTFICKVLSSMSSAERNQLEVKTNTESAKLFVDTKGSLQKNEHPLT